MLFKNHNPRSNRQVIVINQNVKLAPFLRRLNLLCHNEQKHQLPCTMEFVGEGTSATGSPVATYKCPLCSFCQGWVQDFNTGKPKPLWSKHQH
ncbi:MAG: hypothetical protein C4527_01690 [Candidatus Omnitrophota bacterium]|nr:MAG: hypothetical protein C4527_01690 [Candidatus Omnitrophota bacterium]